MATAEGTLPRSGRGRHRRYGLGLPAPPTDEEKKSYADRNIALIIRTSLASFGALLISQARFVFLTPALTWSFLPFLTFTVVYYVLSLTVNAGTRGFDQAAHVGPCPRGTRPVPVPGRVPPRLRRAAHGPAQHLGARGQARPRLPGNLRPFMSSTTEPTLGCAYWPVTSGSAGLRALIAAG